MVVVLVDQLELQVFQAVLAAVVVEMVEMAGVEQSFGKVAAVAYLLEIATDMLALLVAVALVAVECRGATLICQLVVRPPQNLVGVAAPELTGTTALFMLAVAAEELNPAHKLERQLAVLAAAEEVVKVCILALTLVAQTREVVAVA
jgi:hypothetical protein